MDSTFFNRSLLLIVDSYVVTNCVCITILFNAFHDLTPNSQHHFSSKQRRYDEVRHSAAVCQCGACDWGDHSNVCATRSKYPFRFLADSLSFLAFFGIVYSKLADSLSLSLWFVYYLQRFWKDCSNRFDFFVMTFSIAAQLLYIHDPKGKTNCAFNDVLYCIERNSHITMTFYCG